MDTSRGQQQRGFRGQAIAEYAVVVAVITAAVTVMQMYARRSIQSQIRATADLIGDQGEGIKFETGQARNPLKLSGRTEARESKSRQKTDREIVLQNLPDGATTMTIRRDRATTLPSLTDRGIGVVSYSETRR